jgi:hypothetical protein
MSLDSKSLAATDEPEGGTKVYDGVGAGGCRYPKWEYLGRCTIRSTASLWKLTGGVAGSISREFQALHFCMFSHHAKYACQASMRLMYRHCTSQPRLFDLSLRSSDKPRLRPHQANPHPRVSRTRTRVPQRARRRGDSHFYYAGPACAMPPARPGEQARIRLRNRLLYIVQRDASRRRIAAALLK